MKKLTWEDVTVQQFIDIQKLAREKNMDEMEMSEKAIAIMYDMTERQVEELPLHEFNSKSREIAFVLDKQKIEGKPRRVIQANGNKYAIEYDPSKLKHRQYVEIMTWSGASMHDNIYLIMASLVQPVNRIGRRLKNKAEEHPKIAEDMLQAKIVDVYHTCVFFCRLYINLMKDMRDSLVAQMVMQGATKEQAMVLYDTSLNAMAGFITPEKSQHSKVFQ
jgi:hypothetical protein